MLSGRAHLYEGYSPGRVTYRDARAALLGVKSVVLTNAAGGINLDLQRGGLVLITDHINLQGVNPLVGANEDDFGPRFPDMTEAYRRASARSPSRPRRAWHRVERRRVRGAARAQSMKRPRRSGSCGPSAPTGRACRRSRRRSSRTTWA